jgi:hypothetical protein
MNSWEDNTPGALFSAGRFCPLAEGATNPVRRANGEKKEL